jgi:phosphatidylserine/phosphatidylglycerophosphate/cardiolipin synthase-like enzyme
VLTLQQLKDKWFLTLDGGQLNGLPNRRHTPDADAGENALSVSTDGNTVLPLIDGKAYMISWHDGLLALHSRPGAEMYHAGWRLEDVKTQGELVSTHGALDDLLGAKIAGGVPTYVLASAHVGSQRFNKPSIRYLRDGLLTTACRDNRFPPFGSNHQKYAVMKHSGGALAVVGSIDISKSRWDTPAHAAVDLNRNPTYGRPTHDTGVLLSGPAVADLEKSYRERWNDPTRTLGMQPLLPRQPLITTPISSSVGVGTHAVQTLRTFGVTSDFYGYSWSPRGEFSAWTSYINAIKKATTYIYIEDQYFLPFDWPPCYARLGTVARDTDIVYQLGEAMKRGVRVAVLTPNNAEDPGWWFIKYQRDVGVNYLLDIKAAGAPGEVVVAALQNGSDPVYVHSKLMLIDDEVMFIGSNNVGQRSMTYDGELHVAVVDADDQLVRTYRKDLWAEHTGRPTSDFEAPIAAYATFKSDTGLGTGHLTPYVHDPAAHYPPKPGSKSPSLGHEEFMRDIAEPYAGPPGLR